MKCPECNTENGYIRMNTDEWVCRKCGTITKKSEIPPKELIEEIKEEVEKNEL